ncbi:hypothetical protein Sps_02983 [Shewanella psychrophila]|uniref:Uncharacterized protein n=1 Tax=Shewanella psychrophila TaxID=225848 RepID=A0A1S6HRI1_9GAMM|nr:hypothetical protein [Shewanella psychrophila]AQS38130.1 hypothetical protein Sps_02983 [Shewanella psychrophila]
MSVYYAFEYPHGNVIKVGEPNPVTGDRNIKGQLFAFSNKGKRINFISSDAPYRRVPMTHKGVRYVHLGMSLKTYKHMLTSIEVL